MTGSEAVEVPRGRLTLLTPADMSEDQRAVYDAIASGPRSSGPSDFALQHDDGSLTGPFNAMVIGGPIGNAVQAVGAAIRYHGRLDPDCRELAILLVARHRRCDFEWFAHAPIAHQAGLPAEDVESLRLGAAPVLGRPALVVTYDVTSDLLATGAIGDLTFAQAVATLGEERTVELVWLIGYYSMLANALNAFAIGAPGGDQFGDTAAAVGRGRGG